MHLALRSTFLSIKDFPDIDLPKFALLTGINGSGKSHVLRAIKEGRIQNDVTADLKNEVRLYDWMNFFPKDTGIFDSQAWMRQRSDLFNTYQNYVRQHGNEILDTAKNAGVPARYLIDAAHVAAMDIEHLTSILPTSEAAQSAKMVIDKAANDIGNKIRQQFRNNDTQRQALDAIIAYAKKPIVALGARDFYSDAEDRWGRVDLFQQSLAQVFVAYRDLMLKHELTKLAKQRGETPDNEIDILTETNMIPPWKFVNDAIKTARLDFEVDHPDLYQYLPYQPHLTKCSTGADLFFGDLSSGEKILMSLALCLYYTEDARQITVYPKLLLLDEIDAPLHPSMARLYLDVLNKTVVEKHNIHVVATTHSASTVALASEDALYMIEPNKPGLHKTTRARALNILTEGVPTLAISFEGRRQVFVESTNDAELYDVIHQILKAKLRSERSLEFVATGIKNPSTGEHLNTGCATVRHLVDALTKSGNSSVFGLIDWDGENISTSRVFVLAEGRRNAIENVILDPLLVATTIVATEKSSISKLDIPNSTSYPSFLQFTPHELQSVVNKVQESVLQSATGSKIKCSYCGGFTLDIDENYLTLDDHELEVAVLRAFPGLNAFSKGRSGALMLHVARTAIKDNPDFVPSELFDVLQSLLNQPAH